MQDNLTVQKNCYNFIHDEKELERFVDSLRDNTDNEKYLICLFARKKYDTSGLLKSDKSQIKRFICNKSDIIKKIKTLQVEVGLYTFDGEPIPPNTFALYINPTPRDVKKSYFNILKKVADSIESGFFINPTSMTLNCVHKSKPKSGLFDIDLDLKEDFKYKGIIEFRHINEYISDNNILPYYCYDLVRTNGGFHVLVKTDLVPNEYKKKWHNNFSQIRNVRDNFNMVFEDVMMNGDGFIPIAGTYQGGKPVTFERHENEKQD